MKLIKKFLAGKRMIIPKKRTVLRTIPLSNGSRLTAEEDTTGLIRGIFWFRDNKYITPLQLKKYKFYDSSIKGYRQLNSFTNTDEKGKLTVSTPLYAPNLDWLSKTSDAESRYKLASKLSIPIKGLKIITLKTKGNMNLADVPVNMLDSIAVNAGRSNTDFWTSAALIGKESTFGGMSKTLHGDNEILYGTDDGKFNPGTLTNNHSYFSSPEVDYWNALFNKYLKGVIGSDDKERLKAEADVKYAREHGQIVLRTPQYSLYVLADAFKRYNVAPNKYNPGLKNYVSMVNGIRLELQGDRLLQEYWNTRGKLQYARGMKEGMKHGGKFRKFQVGGYIQPSNVLEAINNGSAAGGLLEGFGKAMNKILPTWFLKAGTYLSPLNYAAALSKGSINPKVGEEVISKWHPNLLLVARIGELAVGPKAVKGAKTGAIKVGNTAINTAAKAGNKTAKKVVVAREINKAVKENNPQLSNRTISVDRNIIGINRKPDLTYTLYNEFGEPIGQTKIGDTTVGRIERTGARKLDRMVDGVYSKNKAHKVSEDTYNVAVQDIIDNGGTGLESGWSLMMPLKTLPVTSKFPHVVIGQEFGNPVRLLTGRTSRPLPQKVKGNHYLEIKPKTEVKFNEITGDFEEVPIKESVKEPKGLTSLKFFERKPSKLNWSEKVGLPKEVRNRKVPQYTLENARQEALLIAKKWGYELPENATIQQIEELYNLHNTFFRGVTTGLLEKTKNRIAKELNINPEDLTKELYLLYVSTHAWPGNDRIWVTPMSHYGEMYGNGDMIRGGGLLSAVMRPWKTTKNIKQWPKEAEWQLGFKEDVNEPVLVPWVSKHPNAIRSRGALTEFLIKGPLIYRGLGKNFKGTLLQQLKYNDGQGKLGWIESLVGELPTEIYIEKQGGKMNFIDFLKNGSGIHIKKENRGKFTDYCGGKVTSACIAKAKASGNKTLIKRATFAANARKWNH